MTGFDIYNRVSTLLGYSEYNHSENRSGAIIQSAMESINSVLEDLRCEKIKSMSTDIPVDSCLSQAVVYGTAMLLALIEGENQKSEVFRNVYNAKRCAALTRIVKIKEKDPSDFGSESHEL